ncbi:MAG TPA: type II 3-dehydroquinate dehydratase [Bacteroidales bacterium]|nr:type II 3-dehydroquinate dehydratase [Bacteroidales bacterium]HOE04333.1 type II 3-dehydroquinate dehydratase [Bacteroidales bacterium]HQL70105.1 type II 3-dehydroquinate dehydratase [Bacteroidales bacterium]
MKNILIINGPNLNLLGIREPGIYGSGSWENCMAAIRKEFDNHSVDYYHSNYEGDLVQAIQAAMSSYSGIVLNAGAFTHTSVALRDAIAACSIPVIEVHISNTSAREYFRQNSLTAPVCKGVISGFGTDSYKLAIHYLINLL